MLVCLCCYCPYSLLCLAKAQKHRFAFMCLHVPPKMKKGGVALLPELLVLFALHASHTLHHLFAQLHGRRQRFGVSAKDVAEVDVEELPWMEKGENLKKT